VRVASCQGEEERGLDAIAIPIDAGGERDADDPV